MPCENAWVSKFLAYNFCLSEIATSLGGQPTTVTPQIRTSLLEGAEPRGQPGPFRETVVAQATNHHFIHHQSNYKVPLL